MRLSQFITRRSKRVIAEWAAFAGTTITVAGGMNLVDRRDHVAGMLNAIARDLDSPQTKKQKKEKSRGEADAHPKTSTAAKAHGTDRAATGYTQAEMISEFRALRASILRLWTAEKKSFAARDIEDMTRFNEAIDQLLAESIATYMTDVARSKDLFLGVLGHDLRNPLGAILMAATMMITQEGPDWPHLKMASRIVSSGTRMDGIITDLLDFTRSRLGAGIPIVLAPTDLELLCRQTVDEITAFHPGTTVHFDARGALKGKWDGGRIAQALSNLLGNAYQHGSDKKAIDVTLRGKSDCVLLTVHNEGRPIPKTQLQDVFDPFRQLDPRNARSRELGSLGLGLYITRAIATAHQGTVGVESSAKRGTTFTMCLPRSVSARGVAPSAGSSRPAPRARARGKAPRR